MSATLPKNVAEKMRKLTEAARALQQGTRRCLSITRLTSLKSLCQDPKTASRFALYLAERTLVKVNTSPCPTHLKMTEWIQHKELIAEAFTHMRSYLARPTQKKATALWRILSNVERVQSYSGTSIWGRPLRIIHNRDVLVVENALRCILSPAAASGWAYQAAKDYTEEYNPHYGTGLIPESVPMLEDIIHFWTEYYALKSSRQVRGKRS